MGPDTFNESRVGNIHYPPRTDSYGDKMLRREAFIDWAMKIQTCAGEGDSKGKAIIECLALKLYGSVAIGDRDQIKVRIWSPKSILNLANVERKL